MATSRNDNHGGSLTHRMQHFVDGFVAQCKRHDLCAELILVEWNPPPDRPPLIDELRWPKDAGPCEIRIVTVARDLHVKFVHADKIPLYQMIAKNVGIRRARGRYVLATNIDILFSDSAIRYMRDRLRSGRLYRTVRVDVPTDVPKSEDFSEVLDYCEREGFRIHLPALSLVRKGATWSRRERFRAWLDPRLAYLFYLPGRTIREVRGVIRKAAATLALTVGRMVGSSKQRGNQSADSGDPLVLSHLWFSKLTKYARAGVTVLPQRLILPWTFTNACGDFTLLSREDWFRLGGYPEWDVFSWHLDSILMYHARGLGLREVNIGVRAPIYHIEHGKGSGYTPEGADALFSSLVSRGIPFLSNADLERIQSEIKQRSHSRQSWSFNDSSWGMNEAELLESNVYTG